MSRTSLGLRSRKAAIGPSDVRATAVGQQSHTRSSTSVSPAWRPSRSNVAARTVMLSFSGTAVLRRRPSASGPFRELERRGRAGGLDPAQNRAIAGHGQLGLAAASGSRRRSDPLNRELILVNRRAGGGTAAQGGGGDQQSSGTHAREPIDLTASRHLKIFRSFRQNPLTRPR